MPRIVGQSDASPLVYAGIGVFLLLPTILFASTGFWVGMACSALGASYLWVVAFVKWRKSVGRR
jgi:hypothetical protein